MYNKKLLNTALRNLNKAKAPVSKKDTIYNQQQSDLPIAEEGGAKSSEKKEFVNAQEHGVDTPIYADVEVKPSKIHGDGLFAKSPIQEGSIIGISHIRKEFERDGQLYQAPFPSKILGLYNHDDKNPNVYEIDYGDYIAIAALRNIEPGEEIVSDYTKNDIKDLETPDDFEDKPLKANCGIIVPKTPKITNTLRFPNAVNTNIGLIGKNAPFYNPSGQSIISKGRSFGIPETNAILQNIALEMPETGLEKPPVYYHGTNSAALKGVTDFEGLVSLGELEASDIIPQSGELAFGASGINQNFLSTAFANNLDAATAYSMLDINSNPTSDFSKWWDTNRLKYIETPYTPSKGFYDNLLTKRLEEYNALGGLEKSFIDNKFPMLFGIHPIHGDNTRFKIPISTIDGETGIGGKVGFDEMTNLFVPQSKVGLTQEYLQGRIPFKVSPIEPFIDRLGFRHDYAKKRFYDKDYQTGGSIKANKGLCVPKSPKSKITTPRENYSPEYLRSLLNFTNASNKYQSEALSTILPKVMDAANVTELELEPLDAVYTKMGVEKGFRDDFKVGSRVLNFDDIKTLPGVMNTLVGQGQKTSDILRKFVNEYALDPYPVERDFTTQQFYKMSEENEGTIVLPFNEFYHGFQEHGDFNFENLELDRSKIPLEKLKTSTTTGESSKWAIERPDLDNKHQYGLYGSWNLKSGRDHAFKYSPSWTEETGAMQLLNSLIKKPEKEIGPKSRKTNIKNIQLEDGVKLLDVNYKDKDYNLKAKEIFRDILDIGKDDIERLKEIPTFSAGISGELNLTPKAAKKLKEKYGYDGLIDPNWSELVITNKDVIKGVKDRDFKMYDYIHPLDYYTATLRDQNSFVEKVLEQRGGADHLIKGNNYYHPVLSKPSYSWGQITPEMQLMHGFNLPGSPSDSNQSVKDLLNTFKSKYAFGVDSGFNSMDNRTKYLFDQEWYNRMNPNNLDLIKQTGGSVNRHILRKLDRDLKDPYRSKRYSKSLLATNELFAPNYLFSKPSPRRIYNPNAKYFKYGGVPHEGDPPNDEYEYFDKAKQWVIDWHNSPMYQQMVLNSYDGHQKNADYLNRLRKKNIETTPELIIEDHPYEGSPTTAGTSESKTGQIKVYPYGYGFGPSLYVEEILHSSDRPRELYKHDHPSYKTTGIPEWMIYKDPRFPNEIEVRNRVMPVRDQRYINTHRGSNWKDNEFYKLFKSNKDEIVISPSANAQITDFIAEDYGIKSDDPAFPEIFEEVQNWVKEQHNNKYIGAFKKNWKEMVHNYISIPSEVRARLGRIRYNAQQEGIYDPFTEQITPEIFQNYINKERDPENWQPMAPINDLRKDFTDEEIIKMLNTISKNEETSDVLDMQYARDGGPIVKQRKGVRENSDGSESTHIMMAEYIPERGWVGFPSLFQDEDGTWVDMSKEEDWMKIYEEAERRGEVYDFGEDKEAALAFGEGSWKNQLSDEFIEAELSEEEIQKYVDGGYIVEDLPKAKNGIGKLLRDNNFQTSLGYGKLPFHGSNYTPQFGLNTVIGSPRKGFWDLGTTLGGDKDGFSGGLQGTYYGPFIQGNRHSQAKVDQELYYDQGTAGYSATAGMNFLGGNRNIGNKRDQPYKAGTWTIEGGPFVQIGAWNDLNRPKPKWLQEQHDGAPIEMTGSKWHNTMVDVAPGLDLKIKSKPWKIPLTFEASGRFAADLVESFGSGAAKGHIQNTMGINAANPDAPQYTNADQFQQVDSVVVSEAEDYGYKPEYKWDLGAKIIYDIDYNPRSKSQKKIKQLEENDPFYNPGIRVSDPEKVESGYEEQKYGGLIKANCGIIVPKVKNPIRIDPTIRSNKIPSWFNTSKVPFKLPSNSVFDNQEAAVNYYQDAFNQAMQNNKDWLNSEEYVNRRQQMTGESYDQIVKDVSKRLEYGDIAAKNITVEPIEDYVGLADVSKGKPNITLDFEQFFTDPTDMVGTINHEFKHIYSPLIDPKWKPGRSVLNRTYQDYLLFPLEYPKTSFSQEIGDMFKVNSDLKKEIGKVNYLTDAPEQDVRAYALNNDIRKVLGLPTMWGGHPKLTETNLNDYLTKVSPTGTTNIEPHLLNSGLEDVNAMLSRYIKTSGYSRKNLLDGLNKAWSFAVPLTLGASMFDNYSKGGELPKANQGLCLPKFKLPNKPKIPKELNKVFNVPFLTGKKYNWAGDVSKIYNPYFKKWEDTAADIDVLNNAMSRGHRHRILYDDMVNMDSQRLDDKSLQIIDPAKYEDIQTQKFWKWHKRYTELDHKLRDENGDPLENYHDAMDTWLHKNPAPLALDHMRGVPYSGLQELHDLSTGIRNYAYNDDVNPALDLYNIKKEYDQNRIKAFNNLSLKQKFLRSRFSPQKTYMIDSKYLMTGFDGKPFSSVFNTYVDKMRSRPLDPRLYLNHDESPYAKFLDDISTWKRKSIELLTPDSFDTKPPNNSDDDGYINIEKDGGMIELGDEVDEATMERLKKLGYTFEEI